MSDVERVRIEFNYDPDHYGVNHPVGRAIQDLYTAVMEAAGSVRAANWTETMVEEEEDA